MNIRSRTRQAGIALPVMLIVLMVMLLGSIYLMKASTTTTMITTNLAYDAALSKAADLGLLTGADWLSTTADGANRDLLYANNVAAGYVATYDPTVPPSNSAFWTGSVSLTDAQNNKIEYVIHRLCSTVGAYDVAGNACVQTTADKSASGGVAVGASLSSDAEEIPAPPQVHYVITARINAARGGNVVNQAVVMIGA